MFTCGRCGTRYTGVCPTCYGFASPAAEESQTKLAIETEQEVDGRWLAEVPDLPGVIVYGTTEAQAVAAVRALAAEVLSERKLTS